MNESISLAGLLLIYVTATLIFRQKGNVEDGNQYVRFICAFLFAACCYHVLLGIFIIVLGMLVYGFDWLYPLALAVFERAVAASVSLLFLVRYSAWGSVGFILYWIPALWLVFLHPALSILFIGFLVKISLAGIGLLSLKKSLQLRLPK